MQIKAEGVTWPLQTFLDAHGFLPGEQVRADLAALGTPEHYRLKAVLVSGDVVELRGDDLRLKEALGAKPGSSEIRLAVCDCGERLATVSFRKGLDDEQRPCTVEVIECLCAEETLY